MTLLGHRSTLEPSATRQCKSRGAEQASSLKKIMVNFFMTNIKILIGSFTNNSKAHWNPLAQRHGETRFTHLLISGTNWIIPRYRLIYSPQGAYTLFSPEGERTRSNVCNSGYLAVRQTIKGEMMKCCGMWRFSLRPLKKAFVTVTDLESFTQGG